MLNLFLICSHWFIENFIQRTLVAFTPPSSFPFLPDVFTSPPCPTLLLSFSITHRTQCVLLTNSLVWSHPLEHGYPTGGLGSLYPASSRRLLLGIAPQLGTGARWPLFCPMLAGLTSRRFCEFMGSCPSVARRYCLSLALPVQLL